MSDKQGNERLKVILHQVLGDICQTIKKYDITDEEFWLAVNYLNELGERKEAALLAAGLGLEHYLDIRGDDKEAAAGIEVGTPRAIEGPLYMANAPLSQNYARMDDGTEQAEIMWLQGKVTDSNGKPVAGAVVDIWHANTLGHIHSLTSRKANITCAAASRTVPMAATPCAVLCRAAMVTLQMTQPKNC